MQVLRLGKLQNKVGKEISDGHAFSKHVIKQGEFKNVNVSTRENFEKYI